MNVHSARWSAVGSVLLLGLGDVSCSGGSCTVVDNGDGTATITCPDGSEATVSDGDDGAPGDAGDTGAPGDDGGPGPAGDPGAPGVDCTLTDNGDGTVTFACGDGSEWTFAPGCTVRQFTFPTHNMTLLDCPDGTESVLAAAAHASLPGRPGLLSGGGLHTCFLDPQGRALCWGDDNDGQLDAPDETFVQVSAGGLHTCGLRPDDLAECWGNDDFYQADPGGDALVQVVSGLSHTCGLTHSGFARCWGNSEDGQADDQNYELFAEVGTGLGYTCGLRTNGTVWCWGEVPDDVPAPGGVFVQIAVGSNQVCGLRTDGSAVCWGNDAFGQAEEPPGPFVSLTSGSTHVCGLKANGSAVCWGVTYDGDMLAPPGETYVQISSGDSHACGLRPDGSVLCWGDDDAGLITPPTDLTCHIALASPPAGILPGLAYEEYVSQPGSEMPDFTALGSPTSTGVVSNVQLPVQGETGIAVLFQGFLHVDERAFYTFRLTSDDGSRVSVGTDLIVDNDGQHPVQSREHGRCLMPGWHPLRVEYWQGSDEEALSLEVAKGDAAYAPIPNADVGYVP